MPESNTEAKTQPQTETVSTHSFDDLKNELRRQLLAEMSAAQQTPVAPVAPETPPLKLADVLTILVHHSTVPTEMAKLRMLDAINREFADLDETDQR